MNKKILIILTFGLLLSERGDLISYEYKEFKLANDIQTELDLDVGQLDPNAIYDIELYSIVYETIDQFGETTQASGSIAIPYDNNFAYPFYLFGHGTQIRRLSAPSMNGFNTLNMNRIYSGAINKEIDNIFTKFLGFKREGTLRKNVFKNGEYFDTYLHGILK